MRGEGERAFNHRIKLFENENLVETAKKIRGELFGEGKRGRRFHEFYIGDLAVFGTEKRQRFERIGNADSASGDAEPSAAGYAVSSV